MPNHFVVVGLGYGDEGKGSVTDYLTREALIKDETVTICRFNGGAQAAHNVCLPDGTQHTFAQFGSGTLAGAHTHLSRFMLVDPMRMASEAVHLQEIGVPDPWASMTIEREAMLITPYHREVNRARELARGDHSHGSCGVGVGETMAYSIAHPGMEPRVADCLTPMVLLKKLRELREWAISEFPVRNIPTVPEVWDVFLEWAKAITIVDRDHLGTVLDNRTVIFEGAQGVLLDEWHGFHPYTTWSTTTTANADTLLSEAGHTATRLGLLRAYTTRHGSGPFVAEDKTLSIPEWHNGRGQWQGDFRLGHFDVVAARYAIEVTSHLDGLVLTHLDRLATADLKVVSHYETPYGVAAHLISSGPGEQDLPYQEMMTKDLLATKPVIVEGLKPTVEVIEDELGIPVVLGSYGPTFRDKKVLNTTARVG